MSDIAKTFYDGIAAINNRDPHRAEVLFKRVLRKDKSNVPALNLLVVALMNMERFAEAEPFIARAVSIDGKSDVSFYNYGLISKHLNKPDHALKNFSKALALNPNKVETWNNRATVFNDLGKPELALEDLDRAISLNRLYSEAYANKGKTLSLLKRHLEALSAYEQALSITPQLAEAWFGRGNSCYDLKRYDEAFVAYDRAFSLKPDLEGVEGARLHTKMRLCRWEKLEEEINHLEASIRSGKASCGPFALLSLSGSSEDQFRCAQIWAAKHPESSRPVWQGSSHDHKKVRIGYVSSDFNRHPTAYLTAELFELHDKDRFELFAFSLGADDNSAIRRRLIAAFDKFVDCSEQSDADIARAIADAEIDILIDLNGFTKGARTNIFAQRASPIQVNYLGYPGTMAAAYIDYVIGDGTIFKASDVAVYTEKLVKLPHCYQPNDRQRLIDETTIKRHDFGLPNDQFVFCCFNNSYKISPAIFERWMRILKAVEGSVLWLLAENGASIGNLKKEAKLRGVDPARLVFAERTEPSAHLARHCLADLFLDTLPYNAHTTASDALWTGLPVLTQLGETFAGRVAASLLRAVELPELIAQNSEQYEELAIELARNADRLAAIKGKLEKNRIATPLFNTEMFARHIESAYQAMYDRWRARMPPDHIVVPG